MSEERKAIERLLYIEGEELVKNDNGRGCARYGITEAFARETVKVDNPAAFVRNLTWDQAYNLYRFHFWQSAGLSEVASQRIANALLSAYVNCWFRFPTLYAQQAYNRTRQEGWPLLYEDGRMGPKTRAALSLMKQDSPQEKVFLAEFNRRMLARYRHLAEAKPELYDDDLKGWENRVMKASA